MDTRDVTAPRRRFAGRHDAAGLGEEEFAALAEVLLSPQPAAPPTAVETPPAADADVAPPPEIDAPQGLYVLVPAGIEPVNRRDAALAAARRLAPGRRPAAVFVFENGLVEAHVLGETACGRLGPQNYLGALDLDRTIADLLAQCDQVGVVVLDPPNGRLRGLGSAARRIVFLATADAESVVETYRTLKAWRMGGALAQAALLLVDGNGDGQAGRLGRRLRRAARGYLGCEVAIQRDGPAAGGDVHVDLPQPVRIFSQTPADEVWPRLLAAAGCAEPMAAAPVVAAPESRAVVPARTDICPAFSLWDQAERGELLTAIEAQLGSLVGGSLRVVFQVEVDEPGAPPLAGVRDDGALVAILLPGPGEAADTAAAERWLEVHRSLLARAYGSAEIAAGPKPTAIALAPLEAGPPAEGIRRFVPVRLGGHKGIVLLP
ncbi:MAG TPA: hypothetical protein VM431_00715 [Phycisphaerae bacterium]|nr:hypothetical protein [Phycisphaerae bacterium]